MELPSIEYCIGGYSVFAIFVLLLILCFKNKCSKKCNLIIAATSFVIVSTTVFTLFPFGITAYIDSQEIATYLGLGDDPALVRSIIVAAGDVSGAYLYAFYFCICKITDTKMLKISGVGIILFGAIGDNIFRAFMIMVIAPAVNNNGNAVLSPELNTVFGIFRKISFVIFAVIYSSIVESCPRPSCYCKCCRFSKWKLQEKKDSKDNNDKFVPGYVSEGVAKLYLNYCCMATSEDGVRGRCKIGIFCVNFILFFLRTGFCTCIYYSMSWISKSSLIDGWVEFIVLTLLGIVNVAFLFFVGHGQDWLVEECNKQQRCGCSFCKGVSQSPAKTVELEAVSSNAIAVGKDDEDADGSNDETDALSKHQ